MYLLNTDISTQDNVNLTLELFTGENLPQYAILSHTWGNDEVLYSHVYDGTFILRAGFKKIQFAIEQARNDGYQYIWVDSCCIDKSSSAELSEAINSMYIWYQQAAVCYAYLEDVPQDADPQSNDSAFSRSRWFTRGWTLQELLAPRHLTFFSSEWTPIGDKSDLCELLSTITKVDLDILKGERLLDATTTAQRMIWAANRKTTRGEDMAYCLMGIFKVNMPMLYGEGRVRAFHRLQREIMNYSNDQTLFAWVDQEAPGGKPYGLLADSPDMFLNAGDIRLYADREGAPSFNMSNRGLRIELHLTKLSDDIYAAALNLFSPFVGQDFLAIYLKQSQGDKHQFARVKCGKLGAVDRQGERRVIYVRQDIDTATALTVYSLHCFQLRSCPAAKREYTMVGATYDKAWGVEVKHRPSPAPQSREWVPDACPSSFKIVKVEKTLSAALLFRRRSDGEAFVILLGSVKKFDVGFDVMECPTDTSKLERLQNMMQDFNPKAPGTSLTVQSHRVRVDVEPEVKAGTKIYFVDITIEAVTTETASVEKSLERPGSSLSPKPTQNGRSILHKFGFHRG